MSKDLVEMSIASKEKSKDKGFNEQAWIVLFNMPSFWQSVEESPVMPLRAVYDLMLVCKTFRENIPIDVAVRSIYRPKPILDTLIKKKDATHIFGITQHFLKVHTSKEYNDMSFLMGFNLAFLLQKSVRHHPNAKYVCSPIAIHKKEGIRKQNYWRLLRYSKRIRWEAVCERRKQKAREEKLELIRKKNLQALDSLLDAHGIAAMEGSRLTRLASFLHLRSTHIGSSLTTYMMACVRGDMPFSLAEAESTANTQNGTANLDELDRMLAKAGFTGGTRRQRLMLYLHEDGMTLFEIEVVTNNSPWCSSSTLVFSPLLPYLEEVLYGLVPLCMRIVRFEYAIKTIPSIGQAYSQSKLRSSNENDAKRNLIHKLAVGGLSFGKPFEIFWRKYLEIAGL